MLVFTEGFVSIENVETSRAKSRIIVFASLKPILWFEVTTLGQLF